MSIQAVGYEWWDTAAISAVATLVATALTATLTVPLARRKYRAERMWERKFGAYADIIEALYHIRTFAQRALRQLESTHQLDSDSLASFSSEAAKSRATLRKAITFGDLVLSEDAVARIDKLFADLDPDPNMDLLEEFENEMQVVDAAIIDIRKLARHDLALK